MLKKTIQLTVGLVISGFCLWLVFRKANFAEVVGTLRNADVPLLLVALAVTVAGLMVRSYRWKMLGQDYRAVPWSHFFRATNIGLMLNTFLPFRTGDLFQSYFISRSSGLPKSYTLATVFLERFSDIIPPSIILIVGSLFVVLPFDLSRIVMIVLVGIAALVAIIRSREKLIALAGKYLAGSHSQKIRSLLENIIRAVKFLSDRQVLCVAMPLTLAVWLLYTFSTFLILRSLNIELTFWNAFLIQAVTVMSVAIPASPGYVGTWEFFAVMSLGLFGVNRDLGLSFGLLSHVMSMLPVAVIGLIFLISEVFVKKARLADVVSSADTQP